MIKFGMKLPEIFTQLVKGYRKVTGRDPEGLDLIRIRQESMRRFEDMNKVVDMEGRTLDPSKAITGGTQEDAAFKSGIMKATRTKPKEVETKGLSDKEFRSEKTSFRLNIGKNSPQFNQDLAKRIINKEIYTDLSDSQRKQFLDDLDFVLKNPRDGNADGGRIGFFKGAVAGGENISPGTDTKGNVRDDNPFTGGGGGGENKPTLVAELTPKQKKFIDKKKFGLQENLLPARKIFEMINNPALNIFDKGTFGFGAQEPTTEEEFNEYLKSIGVVQQVKDGGRIGLKKGMDRRTFMKIMGGLTTLPVLGKFFKGAEVAAPVTQKVMENFSSTASEAPQYFLNLVTKIKSFGKQSKVRPSEMMDEYYYTGKNGDQYTLTEDIATGDVQIVKDKMGVGSYGDKTYDTINDRTVLEFRAGRMDVKDEGLETQKAFKEADEYEEYKVEFDQDGTEAGADAIDEMIQKEIIEEAAEEAPSIKKAGGGIARLLGE